MILGDMVHIPRGCLMTPHHGATLSGGRRLRAGRAPPAPPWFSSRSGSSGGPWFVITKLRGGERLQDCFLQFKNRKWCPRICLPVQFPGGTADVASPHATLDSKTPGSHGNKTDFVKKKITH